MNYNKIKPYRFPIFLILSAAILRITRHFGIIDLPPNFAPITAVALFSGAYLKNKKLALITPIITMLIADSIIGFYNWQIMLAVYLSFGFSGLLGLWIRKSLSFKRIFTATLGASILFFILTNLAVWLFSGMYTIDLSGLISCYIIALPFFRNTLLGNFFFVGAMFGIYEMTFFLYKKKFIIKLYNIKLSTKH